MQRESLLSCAHTSYKLINGGRGRQGELPRLERWAEQEERNEFCLFTILLLWRHRQPPLQLVKVNITGQTRWCWRWRENWKIHNTQHKHSGRSLARQERSLLGDLLSPCTSRGSGWLAVCESPCWCVRQCCCWEWRPYGTTSYNVSVLVSIQISTQPSVLITAKIQLITTRTRLTFFLLKPCKAFLLQHDCKPQTFCLHTPYTASVCIWSTQQNLSYKYILRKLN